MGREKGGREKGTKKGKNQKFFIFNSVGKEMQVVLHIQNKNDFFFNNGRADEVYQDEYVTNADQEIPD